MAESKKRLSCEIAGRATAHVPAARSPERASRREARSLTAFTLSVAGTNEVALSEDRTMLANDGRAQDGGTAQGSGSRCGHQVLVATPWSHHSSMGCPQAGVGDQSMVT